MKRQSERGVALILVMILLVVISVMGISLAFISKTETWSSMNYKLMSQARDAAESGINNTANYLMGSTFATLPTTYYTPPGSVSDPLTAYNVSAYPVQNGSANTSGHDVILSASSVSSNYPATAVQSTFNSDGVGKGSFAAGNTTVNYETSAKLLAMQQLDASTYNPSATTLQTWEITSQGKINGVPTANEQITAILERPAVPVFGYAAFATYDACGALDFGGGGNTNSYNSAVANVDPSTMYSTGGNVGTNGGLTTVGSTTNINGSLSTPRAGVGNCTSSNITALDGGTVANCSSVPNTTCVVDGGIVQLPARIPYPTPTIPNPGILDLDTNSACPAISGCTPPTAAEILATGGAAGLKLDAAAAGGTISLRDVNLTGNQDLYLTAGTYNINSISETGNTVLHILSGPVYLNVKGNGIADNQDAVKLTGGGISNPGTAGYPPDPSKLQILYAGTANIKIAGGANSAALVYAPNASGSITGGSDFYGSMISRYIRDFGGAAIHYDRRLKDKFYVPGNYMMSSFTWNKY